MKHVCRLIRSVYALIITAVLSGCGVTRHVPDGELLLDHSQISVTNHPDAGEQIKPSDLSGYLRQQPNHRLLGFWNAQLHTYSLSGADSTKWYNRWLRRLGRPPVIYSPDATANSTRQLRLALINRGYMNPTVMADTVITAPKKVDVTYRIAPGMPHRIGSINYEFADSAVGAIIMADAPNFSLGPGMPLDRNLLDAERTRLTGMLRDRGYFAFVKDYITFTADTAEADLNVNLTMQVHNPPDGSTAHPVFRIARVIFEPDYQPGAAANEPLDTIRYRSISVVYPKSDTRPYLKPKLLWDNNYMDPGSIYSAAAVNRTYEALSRLGMVRSASVVMHRSEIRPTDSVVWLDAVVRLTRNTKQGITAELEGTNSEGDLGFGVGVTYRHRNAFHGSELITVKARGSYESLSGNLEGLINNHYTEAGAELALTLPTFRAPFINRDFRRKVLASTEFSLNFNYQERPEYTRIIAGAGWKYKWNSRNNNSRRVLDVLDVSYVYLPRSTINFLDQIAPSNPLVRYSYEDHFIMRIGFSYFKTNKALAAADMPGKKTRRQRRIYTLRASAESAGNLLYGISSAIGQKKRGEAYRIFGIQYAQYVKGEADYMYTRNFNARSSLAFHVGAGVGVPYGNSSMLPFEKRFYAGGANSVRGWGVRTLGPGRYHSVNSVSGFINQCGDIRLDLSAEYRVKLFWVFEGALFIDAGNVWTIRSYENQPDGLFRFGSFYKELAWAYGVGLRLDFNYFLLRFDLGMKAYNPAIGEQPWPLTHPRWHRDATFHFSVGYPF